MPVDFDGQEDVDYRFEFYRVTPVPSSPNNNNYEFIRSEEVQTGPEAGSGDISTSFTFDNIVEVGGGERISVLAVQTGGTGIGDTSELSPTASIPETPPPSILNVTLSNGTDNHSFTSLINAPGNDSGEQLQYTPFNLADTVKITFSEAVSLPANLTDQIELKSLRTGNVYPVSYVSPNGNDHTWQLTGGSYFTEDDQILLTIKDEIQSASSGLALDGEWANPPKIDSLTTDFIISDFPSGDGEAGGDFRFVFNAYISGDYNYDGSVTQGDLDLVLLNWGSTTLPPGWINQVVSDGMVSQNELDAVLPHWGDKVGEGVGLLPVAFGDLNNDGTVNQGDLDIVLLNWGMDEADLLDDALWQDLDMIMNQTELDAVLLNWGASI